MNIRMTVAASLARARQHPEQCSWSKQKLHRERSLRFVEHLADGLAASYQSLERVAALTKHVDKNRARFGSNELLFDISVVEYATVNSGRSNKELSYVTRALWLVESELSRDTRQALYDFNKLVIAAAENVLFVGPLVADVEQYLHVLASPARHCSSAPVVALIPHPSQWCQNSEAAVRAWRWSHATWKPID